MSGESFFDLKHGLRWQQVVAVVGLVAAGATAVAGFATKDQLTAAMDAHAGVEHERSRVRITVVEKQVLTVQHDLDDVQEDVAQLTVMGHDSLRKLDALQQMLYESARTDPDAARAVRRAARKVRKRAQEEGAGDPLEGVDGL